MDVLSLCRLPVGIVRWRSPAPSLTVIVKATFTLERDGYAMLAADQQPLSLDRAGMQTGPNELFLATDFVPFKPRADVLLAGHAHAPAPVWAIRARLVVNAFDKPFFAFAGKPAVSIPLAETHLRSGPSREAAPVQVAARAPWSPERAVFAGAPLVDPSGVPLAPLPQGFDYRVFHAAPQDQQIDTLLTTAVIVLEGLLPGAPLRRVQLPGIHPRVFLLSRSHDPRRAAPAEASLRADTLWIDVDRAQCTLTFRGVVQTAEEPAQLVMVLAQPGVAESWPSICDQLGQAVHIRAVEAADLAQVATVPAWPPDPSGESTVDLDWAEQKVPPSWMPDTTGEPVPSGPALPFVPAPVSTAEPPSHRDARGAESTPAIAAEQEAPEWASATVGLRPGQVFASAVPFKQPGLHGPAPVHVPIEEQEPEWAGSTTGLKPGQVFAPAVPFKQPASHGRSELAPVTEYADLPEAPGWAQSTVGLKPDHIFAPAVPFDAPGLRVPQIHTVDPASEDQAPAWATVTKPVDPGQGFAPAVPFELAARPMDVRAAPADLTALPFRSGPLHAEPQPGEPPILRTEQYAAIKAAFWAGMTARGAVLEQHGLSEPEWELAEQRQMLVLEREASEGRAAAALDLLSALDEACRRVSVSGRQ